MEWEDVENLLTKEFINITYKYDIERGMAFPTYVKTFLTYAIQNHFRQFTQRNHQVLNYCASLQEETYSSNDALMSSEQIAIDELQELIRDSKLTDTEMFVIENYYLGSKTMKEIGEDLDKDPKSLYYIKDSAYKKMHKSLKSNI